MLDGEQIKNITYVYTKLMESEITGWAIIDDCLELIDWLDDDQLYRECDILYSHHKNKNIGSSYNLKAATDFIKNVLEAVESILELYNKTNSLHPKNRYILSYYLALCQSGHIVELL